MKIWDFNENEEFGEKANLTKIRQRFVKNSKRLQNGFHEK